MKDLSFKLDKLAYRPIVALREYSIHAVKKIHATKGCYSNGAHENIGRQRL